MSAEMGGGGPRREVSENVQRAESATLPAGKTLGGDAPTVGIADKAPHGKYGARRTRSAGFVVRDGEISPATNTRLSVREVPPIPSDNGKREVAGSTNGNDSSVREGTAAVANAKPRQDNGTRHGDTASVREAKAFETVIPKGTETQVIRQNNEKDEASVVASPQDEVRNRESGRVRVDGDDRTEVVTDNVTPGSDSHSPADNDDKGRDTGKKSRYAPTRDELLSGDDAVYKKWFGERREGLIRIASSYVGRDKAEDIAQEAMLNAFRSADTFKEGDTNAWLNTICKNAALDSLRRDKSRAKEVLTTDDRVFESGNADVSHVDEIAELNKIKIGLQEAGLRDDQVAMVLLDLEKVPYEEIGEQLAKPIGTVRSGIHRSKAAARQAILDGQVIEDPNSAKEYIRKFEARPEQQAAREQERVKQKARAEAQVRERQPVLDSLDGRGASLEQLVRDGVVTIAVARRLIKEMLIDGQLIRVGNGSSTKLYRADQMRKNRQ